MYCITKQGPNTNPHISNNKQWINKNRTTALERKAAEAIGGLYAFYLR